MRKILAFLIFLTLSLTLGGCLGQKQETLSETTPTPTAVVKTLKEGEGPQVDLNPRFDKQAVILKIASISSDIKKIDYGLVYDTNGVQRGVLGSLDIKDGQDKIIKEILLASCSRNVCVFDKNVKNLQLTVKFTGNGEPLEFQQEYSL